MKTKLIIIAVLVVVVVGLYVYLRQPAGVVISSDEQLQALNAPALSNNFVLPAVKWLKNGELDLSGPVEYKVSFGSVEGLTMSKIVFDPYDVNPGDTQNIYVIGKYAGGVSGVTASIKTDKGIVPLQLALAQGDAKSGVWKGSWTAKDVHPGYYTVDFTVTSADGKSRGTSAAFLDGLFSDIFSVPVSRGAGVCPAIPPTGGSEVVISGPCALDSSDAVINGDVTINNLGSLSIPAGVTFGFTSSYSIRFNGGSISIANTGKVVKMGVAGAAPGGGAYNAYVRDSDSDNYWNAQEVTSTNPYGAAGKLRSTTPGLLGGGDCYDFGTNAALAYPGQAAYVTSSARGDGSWDYNCSGGTVEKGPATQRIYQCPTAIGKCTVTCQNATCDDATYVSSTAGLVCGTNYPDFSGGCSVPGPTYCPAGPCVAYKFTIACPAITKTIGCH